MGTTLEKGEICSEGQFLKAEKCFLDLLKGNYENVDVPNLFVGAINLSIENSKNSENNFLNPLSIKDNHFNTLIILAEQFSNANRWEEATILLEKYVTIDSQDSYEFKWLDVI